MDFLEGLFNFGDGNRRKNGGSWNQNEHHHDHDDHDDHEDQHDRFEHNHTNLNNIPNEYQFSPEVDLTGISVQSVFSKADPRRKILP